MDYVKERELIARLALDSATLLTGVELTAAQDRQFMRKLIDAVELGERLGRIQKREEDLKRLEAS